MTITYLLPVARPAETRPYNLSVSLHPDKPAVIGLVANGFPDLENYLAQQAKALGEALPNARFKLVTKGPHHQLSTVIKDPLLAELVAECDAVVIAAGH